MQVICSISFRFHLLYILNVILHISFGLSCMSIGQKSKCNHFLQTKPILWNLLWPLLSFLKFFKLLFTFFGILGIGPRVSSMLDARWALQHWPLLSWCLFHVSFITFCYEDSLNKVFKTSCSHGNFFILLIEEKLSKKSVGYLAFVINN